MTIGKGCLQRKRGPTPSSAPERHLCSTRRTTFCTVEWHRPLCPLQEVVVPFPLDCLKGLPYRAVVGPVFAGGGERHDHAVGVCVQKRTAASIAVANVHLPPSLPHAQRQQICQQAASFLLSSDARLQILQGDLNADIGPKGGGWLAKMLASGAWSFLHCPYTDRSPSNIVHLCRPGRSEQHVSKKLTDWLFASARFPPVSCHRHQLPGLSTHLAQYVCFVFDPCHVRPPDPVGCLSDICRMDDAQRAGGSSPVGSPRGLVPRRVHAGLPPPDASLRSSAVFCCFLT